MYHSYSTHGPTWESVNFCSGENLLICGFILPWPTLPYSVVYLKKKLWFYFAMAYITLQCCLSEQWTMHFSRCHCQNHKQIIIPHVVLLMSLSFCDKHNTSAVYMSGFPHPLTFYFSINTDYKAKICFSFNRILLVLLNYFEIVSSIFRIDATCQMLQYPYISLQDFPRSLFKLLSQLHVDQQDKTSASIT